MIRSISRALLVIRTMVRRQGWVLQDLQEHTRLPKTTLFRILQTLQDEGYVRSETPGRYRLTAKVRELGGGYSDKSLVVDVGAPIALRLTKTIKWPLAIGTLDGDALVVRYSTMPYSPLAVHATTLGQRLGLLETAMGRVYLAHCGLAERGILLEHLLDYLPAGAIPPREVIARELEQVARAGYAVRLPDQKRGTATLAVPIRSGEEVFAALSLTTFGKSMTNQLVKEHLPHLQEAARAIAEACLRARKQA